MIKTPDKIRNPKTKDYAVSIMGDSFSFHSIISCKKDVDKLLKTIKENINYWGLNMMVKNNKEYIQVNREELNNSLRALFFIIFFPFVLLYLFVKWFAELRVWIEDLLTR